jgi:hypothetical protein
VFPERQSSSPVHSHYLGPKFDHPQGCTAIKDNQPSELSEQTTVFDGQLGHHLFLPDDPQSAELTDAGISFRSAAASLSDVHGNN